MQLQSFLILCLLVYGVLNHRYRSRHVKIMSTAMIWDIILILQIELSRGAIAKASQALVNPMILNIHVSIAVSTVVLYGVMVFLGRKVLAGEGRLLPLHRKFGYFTLTLRVLTFVTSFWAVVPKE